jgi:protein-S-isoprenylcysteine O-methyltransferase Ste14
MNDTVMKEKNGEHPLGHAGQLMLFCIFLIVWVADSFFLRLSTFPARTIPLFVRLALLVLALLTTMLLFRSAGAVIHHGRRRDHVITTGAFRHVRHPLYLGCLCIYLGVTVATASLFSVAVFVGISVFYDSIAGYEEKLMEARFGEAYENYKKRTGRWLPKFGKKTRG